MQSLSSEGQNLVNDLTQRYGFSPDAVTHMLYAVINGQGTMAQFSHSEFGGNGQWMQGGMLMLGDMFNYALQGRVSGLCNDIAQAMQYQQLLKPLPQFAAGMGASAWWPTELGQPSASGTQNGVQYAYFASACRLAVRTGDSVWVYDTLDHQIGGFSQQQGMGSSICFGSQYGTVDLSALPVVSRDGVVAAPAPEPIHQQAMAPSQNTMSAPPPPQDTVSTSQGGDIFQMIEKLADLKARGILSEQEYENKKADLLSRL